MDRALLVGTPHILNRHSADNGLVLSGAERIRVNGESVRIAIDIRLYDYTGVGEYIKGLLHGLVRTDLENEYTLLTLPEDCEHIRIEDPKFAKLRVDLRPLSLTESIKLSFMLRGVRLTVFHSPHFVIPFHVKGALLVTLHDLIPLRYPHVLDGSSREYYRWMVKMAVRKAQMIIAVSECTKTDIIDFLHVPEEKIVVIHGGVRELFRPSEDVGSINRVCSAYGAGGKFVIYLGQWKPHKNLEGFIRAFHYMKDRSGLPHRLVICGRTDPRYRTIQQLVAELGMQDDVTFTGFVSEDDLPVLLSAADLLAFPSFYEGFGLPPLQAMACGTPVIASDVASLPEVVGDSGLLVNPSDIEELGEAMIRVLTDEELSRQLTEKGLERAKGFSWRKAATKTRELYDEVAQVKN